MGFTLLDRPNPNGPHYYTTRNQPLLAIVVHITAGAEDLDTLADLSAENVAAYAGSTDRDVSWHTGSDTDSWVNLLPSNYTAWHASSYNSCTHGHEISKRHTDWRTMSETWTAKTLRMAALGPNGNGGLRAIALRHNIPLRKATRAELDAQRANYVAGRPWKPVGFISHAEVQPADRTDPGWVGGVDTFPWGRFLTLMTNGEDDDMWLQEDIESDAGHSAKGYQWLTMTNLKAEQARDAALRMEARLDLISDKVDESKVAVLTAVSKIQAGGDPRELAAALAPLLPSTDGVTPEQLEAALHEFFSRIYNLNDAA